MKSLRVVALPLAAALSLLLAACGDDVETTSLTFDSPTIDVAVTDRPPKNASSGDIRAFTSPLTEEGSQEEVGRLDGTVVVTDVEERDGVQVEFRAGTIQLTLDGGNIVASGIYVAPVGAVVPAEGGVERPIVGGTGEYVGARGVLTQTAIDGKAYRNVLEFEVDSD